MYQVNGRRIRGLIMERGLSAKEFAEAAGLRPQTVRRILRGYGANLKTIAAIANFFDIDGNELIID